MRAQKNGRSAKARLSAIVEEHLDKITEQAGKKKTSLDIIRELGAKMKSAWPETDADYGQKKTT